MFYSSQGTNLRHGSVRSNRSIQLWTEISGHFGTCRMVEWNGKFPIKPVQPRKAVHLERWTCFLNLFQVDRTDQFSFKPKVPEILVAFFIANLTTMKNTWEAINNILGRKWRNAKQIFSIKNSNVRNTVTSDPIEISNIFNSHFASVGSKLAKNRPPVQRTYHDFLSQTKSPESSFVFDSVTPNEVELEIACIPNNKSRGMSCMITEMLSECYKCNFGRNDKFVYSWWSLSFRAKNG